MNTLLMIRVLFDLSGNQIQELRCQTVAQVFTIEDKAKETIFILQVSGKII